MFDSARDAGQKSYSFCNTGASLQIEGWDDKFEASTGTICEIMRDGSGMKLPSGGLWVYNNALAIPEHQCVVGMRKGGWTAATGTATRTTFETSTVTLPQLAERLKALIDDLIAHGLIGA